MSSPPQPMSAILQALLNVPAGPSSGGVAATAPAGSFCAEGRLALDALSLAVQGLGTFAGQATPDEAKRLHAASTPAHFGRREATLLDTEVRDTGEIDASALNLQWADGALAALQQEVAQALGLRRVQAWLHKLLVYGPGQFFKPHQDTEKHSGMVATLVLVWPSAHIGGDLRVRHGDQVAHFASQHLQASAMRWFAFFADCRHEVLPVTEGWRIVLSFDLVIPAELAESVLPRLPVPQPLLAAMRAQFFPDDGPRLQPWAFLLEHEYSERGLRWPLLKGVDRPSVDALRAAAESLGLSVHLALAEIHEQWTASVSYRGRRGDDDAPEPDERIDEDMVLDFWVGADDRPLPREALRVDRSDSAGFTDTDESFLVNEEYEGYMGNYGETLDYWYRRAALVIQTPLAAERSRFTTDFDAALADAIALARSGRGGELAQRLQAAAGALAAQCRSQGRRLLDAYAELAAALPDTAQARSLCEGFEWVDLESADAAVLARLAERPGIDWLQDLLRAWAQPAMPRHSRGWRPHATVASRPGPGRWPPSSGRASVPDCRPW